MENRINNQSSQPKTRKTVSIPTPAQIKEYLDKYVIGQDEAKKTLAVAVYNHYKRIRRRNEGHSDGPGYGKSNVLLLGETGSGKTLLVKTIARLLNVPYHIQDCTKITESGYVGSDCEDSIVGLLRVSNHNVAAAQCGIVMLDEVDKLRSVSAGPSITRDVSGTGVQQSLLKIIEGDLVGCPPFGGRKHPEQPLTYVDTSDILFIASGAFVGLEDIIAKRIGGKKKQIGFRGESGSQTAQQQKHSLLSQVQPCDLRDFGLIPEFIGRLPVITSVEPLQKEDLVRILTEPCDSLVNQYRDLLAMDDATLEFTPEALDAIAGLALEMGTGARGLRNIMETVMRDVMFDVPSMRKPRGGMKKAVVTADMVRSKMADHMYGKAQ